MTIQLKNSSFLVAAGFIPSLFLFGCGNTQSSPPPSTSKKASKEATEKDTDPADEGNEETKADSASAATADFAGWCKEAALTKVMQKAPLATYFSELCEDGKPTTLFSTSLLKTAYAGSGAPKLSMIEPISSDSATKTTVAHFGIAIKIPTDSKTYYTEVAPLQGDDATIREMTAAQKGTQKSLTISKRSITDKYWTRGWSIRSETGMTSSGISVTTDSTQAQDQYVLKEDSLYLYTNQTTTATKTIKALSTVTATLDIGGSGYLITIVSLSVDNLGLPAVVESTVQETAKSLVIAMYKMAEKGKSANATKK